MARLNNKETVLNDYQEDLDVIKSEGSQAKQSKLPDPPGKTGRFSISNRSNSRVPSVSPTVSAPTGKDAYGTSMFDNDRELRLPSSIYDVDAASQQGILEGEVGEMRAQEQPWYAKVGAFVPRVAAKTGIEFLKGIGFISNIPGAAWNKDASKLVDGMFIQALNDLDEGIKEQIPVYVRREVENGNFGDRIFSPEFIGTELADGIGFLASSLLTGGVAGFGVKGTSKFIASKLGSLAAVTKGGAKVGQSLDNAIRLQSVALAQSFVESSAETDGAMREFDQYWNEHKQENGTYVVPQWDGSTKTYSQEEIDQERRTLGINTMTMNMLFTYGPNVFTAKAILGTPGKSIGSQLRSIKAKNTGEWFDGARKILQQEGAKKKLLKEMGKEGAKGSAAESWQEASQFAIQEYGKARSRMQTDQGIVEGMVDGYIDAFTTVDGQVSIFLGGLLGLGPGIKRGFDVKKSRVKELGGLVEAMETNMVSLKDRMESYFVKNEDGSFKKKDGNYVPNVAKAMEDLENQMQASSMEAVLTFAKEIGDTFGARNIMAELVMQESFPFFQVEGGEEILTKHLESLSEVIETDGRLLGFKSKEEYVGFLKETASNAKKAYDEIREVGPRFFGLDIRKETDKLSTSQQEQALQAFYNQLEAQAAITGSLIELNKNEKINLEQKIQAIETEALNSYTENVKAPEEGTEMKTMLKALPDGVKQSKLWRMYNAQINQITDALEGYNKQYNDFFNKKEQQKALSHFIKNIEEQVESQQAFEDQIDNNEDFKNRFYDKLIEKGYGKSREEINDQWVNNGVGLENSKGKKYTILKRVDPETNEPTFFLTPMLENGRWDNANRVKLTMEAMEEKGLDVNSIMDPQDYNNWTKVARAEAKSKEYLDRVSEMITEYRSRRELIENETAEEIEKLRNIEREIDSYKSLKDSTLPINEVIEVINQLEDTRDKILRELEQLYVKRERSQIALNLITELEIELQEGIEKGYHTLFPLRLRALEQELREGKFLDYKGSLSELLDRTSSRIVEGEGELNVINALLEEYYDILHSYTGLRDAIESTNGEKILQFIQTNQQFIRENYPDLAQFTRDNLPKGYIKNNLDVAELEVLLLDPQIRQEFLNTIKDTLSGLNLGAEIAFLKVRQKNWKDYINTLLDKRSKLEYYIREQQLLKEIIGLQQIKENEKIKERSFIPPGTNQSNKMSRRVEQEGDSSVIGKGPKKKELMSTITNVYSDASMSNLQPNPKQLAQAVQWSREMEKINLRELDKYTIRVVNNTQLSDEFNVTPPVDDTDALYTILYKDGEAIIGENAEPIYAGLGTVKQYFGKGEYNFDFERQPEYIQLKEHGEVTEENPFEIEGKPYTDYNVALTAVQDLVEENYAQKRGEIQERTNNGEEVYFGVKRVSKGFVPAMNIDGKKKPVEKVFKVRNIIIGDKSTRAGDNSIVPVDDGKVYIELENGQIQRVLNRQINAIENKQQKTKMLDTIIKMMALSKYVGENYNIQFPTKSATIPNAKGPKSLSLFGLGGAQNPGIMDSYISWNTKNPAWSIAFVIDKTTKKKLFVFKTGIDKKTGKVIKHFVDVDSLFREDGAVKTSTDPTLDPLLRKFLEYKYLNVINVGKSMDIKVPIAYDWYYDENLKSPVIEYQMENYKDFVLKGPKSKKLSFIPERLYTDISVPTEENKLPTFVNQYIELGKPLAGPMPPTKPKAETKSTTTAAPREASGLAPSMSVEDGLALLESVKTNDAPTPAQKVDVAESNMNKGHSGVAPSQVEKGLALLQKAAIKLQQSPELSRAEDGNDMSGLGDQLAMEEEVRKYEEEQKKKKECPPGKGVGAIRKMKPKK